MFTFVNSITGFAGVVWFLGCRKLWVQKLSDRAPDVSCVGMKRPETNPATAYAQLVKKGALLPTKKRGQAGKRAGQTSLSSSPSLSPGMCSSAFVLANISVQSP